MCPNVVQVEEIDEDFEKELAAVLTDYKLPPSGPFPQDGASTAADSGHNEPNSTVSFRVMMKRGGRDDKSNAVQVYHLCLFVKLSLSAHWSVSILGRHASKLP